MAISVFPAPVTSSINANAITIASANTMYAAPVSLSPAIYTITCTSTTIATVEFYSGINTLITTAVTASGTVAINLGSAVDRVRIWTNTGSNIVVTITQTAAALTNNFSGTLDTITTVGSSTYTGTSTSGYGYAVLVGGGGGGGSTNNGPTFAGGGGSGGIAEKLVALTGSMPVVIGTGGAGGVAPNPGSAGGSSTFAGMTAGGGAGGAYNSATGGAGGTASGGTYNTTGAPGGNGNSVTPTYRFVQGGGSTGAGGNSPSGSGGGSGIGSGGNGANNGAGGAASGYGAGGGAARSETSTANNGGAGTQGVLYVLKF